MILEELVLGIHACFYSKEVFMMHKKKFLGWKLIIPILGLSTNAQTSHTNPALVALLQAKVGQFSGTKQLSQIFAFDIDVTAPKRTLHLTNVVAQPLKISKAFRFPAAKKTGRTMAFIREWEGSLARNCRREKSGQQTISIICA